MVVPPLLAQRRSLWAGGRHSVDGIEVMKQVVAAVVLGIPFLGAPFRIANPPSLVGCTVRDRIMVGHWASAGGRIPPLWSPVTLTADSAVTLSFPTPSRSSKECDVLLQSRRTVKVGVRGGFGAVALKSADGRK